MTLRRKTILLLTLLGSLGILLALGLGFAQMRIRRTEQTLWNLTDLRQQLLFDALLIRQMQLTPDDGESMEWSETRQLLRQSVEAMDTRFEVLMTGEDGRPVFPAHPNLASARREAQELWFPYRNLVQNLLETPASPPNWEATVELAVELGHRLHELGTTVRDELQRQQARRLLGLGAGLILLLTLAALLGWMIFRQMLAPLDTVLDRVRTVSAGGDPLDAHVPYSGAGTDEIGELCVSFNHFIERLKNVDRHKDRFLANMSHEIRTPLNGIVGFLDNLAGTELNEQQRQYVRVIQSSARALLQVLNDILDFSKIAAQKMQLEHVAFDLTVLADELIAVHREAARGKAIEVRCDTDVAAGSVVRGDPTRLRQVLGNLLSNAVKFTEEGEVRLEIRSVPLPDGKLKASFAVHDTGIGIPSQRLRHLFSAFTQAEGGTTRKYGGTGLGLCIAGNLVQLMGAELQCDSVPGRGTTFRFQLETTAAPPGECVHVADQFTVEFPRGSLKKQWVLVVDDNPTNLFLMETICQSIGLPYMTAVNGKEAMEKAASHTFDLIFMDIQMPVMDGYTAIRKIRLLENCASTQIIALTASAMQEDVEKALGAGSTGFLAKPFERNQLLQVIGEYLGIPFEKRLKPFPDRTEAPEQIMLRRMYDFMREQYQISLGEIKMILAQSVVNWRPQLDDVLVFAQKQNWPAVRKIMHHLKGQLGAIGLPTFAEMADDVNQRIKMDRCDDLLPVLERFVRELSAVFRAVETETTIDRHVHPPALP